MSTAAEPAAPPAIREDVQQQAAEWLTVLMSSEASEAQQAAWQRWRAADPEHEQAWRHIEAVSRRFNGLHRGAAAQALAGTQRKAVNGKRRQVLAWLGVAAGGGMLAAQTGAWDDMRALRADYRTATGERREVILDDGSVLSLNTGSAVNVRFDASRRLIELLAGEILVVSGHGAGSAAPLVVATREGLVRALGTRFAVRQQDDYSTVDVLESAVEIRPRDSAGAPMLLAAGRGVAFSRQTLDAPHAIAAYAHAWSRGQLIVDDVTLGDFLADLARYRPGVIDCAPAVAQLRLSGVFPLADTQRILNMLPNSLPVQVRSRTRYWVSVEPAS
ncbi:fec operon regulator FecR [Janthinobacterium sp. HH103]|uniref:FecR domain-containing protein n=1 Tax=unclassified Janthinobacterium TaxID=2610881 RepID=UPI00087501B4|nr:MULTISPECIES: FecR domain-containing protein [unclassified Janthinobacterium]OEZ61921.1 fec operon regulator FecR [Janthinobacterium sp. HH100]OEZ86120.1 fec operon regulator FecR [Janthinobacterium sp. HH103]OEZ92761.1 fec operon regulator FecR [Janthinobacterium sp. HH106]QOU75707.1 Protein FecR [Janthinobacterium sp. HH102]